MSRPIESRNVRRLAGKHRSSTLVGTLAPWLIIVALLQISLVASTTASAHPVPERAATHELYFGLFYPGTPDIGALAPYESQIGKRASLVVWYQPWETGSQLQTFPVAQMDAVRGHGAIPVLSWDPIEDSPWQLNEPAFSLARIASGAWDSYIRQYAMEAKAWGHPFFMRYASEMNGYWEPWSELNSGNRAGQFVQAWRHVHDIFTSVGATNLTWVWCPNTETKVTTPLEELYPGNAYVDWTCMDGYNFGPDSYHGPWLSFSQVFGLTYNDMRKFIPPTMPIMIGETGSVEDGGSKAAWITDAMTTELSKVFPQMKALVWFDQPATANIDVRIDTSPQSLAAFRQAISTNTYQANIYSTLDQSPIPAPEQVVFPPPPSPVSGPREVSAPPISVSYLTGPSAGTIQVINAKDGKPIPQARVLFQNSTSTLTTTVTNSSGVVTMPAPTRTGIVLEEIAVGSLIIRTHLVLDPQRGYQIAINLATGKITRVVAHIVTNLLPLVIELVLLIMSIAFVCITVFRRLSRRSRRRGRQIAERARREQPSYSSLR